MISGSLMHCDVKKKLSQLYGIKPGLTSPVVMLCLAAVSESDPIQPVREVKVEDIGVNSFTLSWKKAPGASGYKISWIPFLGKKPHK